MSTKIRKLHQRELHTVERLLLKHLQTSMFMLHNLRHSGLNDTAKPTSGTYSGIFSHDDELQGVIAHYWNDFIMIQTQRDPVGLLRHVQQESGRRIKGLIGPSSPVKLLMDFLQPKREEVQLVSDDDLYTLELDRLILPSKLTGGQYTARLLATRDLPTYVQWKMAYARETLKQRKTDISLATLNAEASSALSANGTWVLENGTELLSTCTATAVIDEAIQIGLVWTPLDFRSHDYGRSVVAACLYDAWSKSIRHCYLSTEKHNTAAQHTYQSLGFKIIDEYSFIIFRQPLSMGHSQ